MGEITFEDEQEVRRLIGEGKLGATTVGRVVPAPVYFQDAADYWATIETVAYATRDEVELGLVRGCWFYPKNLSDEGPADSPEVTITYELYFFGEFSLTREDEAGMAADSFNKRMLEEHNKFIRGVMEAKSAFQGLRDMGILDSMRYARQKTTSLVQTSFIANREICRFVPGVLGFQATFDESVKLQLKEC